MNPLSQNELRWWSDSFTRLGLVIVGLFVVMAILQPLLLGSVWASGVYDPNTGFDPQLLHPSAPAAAHFLGTDPLGRDVVSMIMEGSKSALLVSTTAAISSFVSALAIAGLAVGRRPSRWMAWLASNVALMLPAPIVMAILGVSVLGDFFTAPVFGLFFGLLTGMSTAGLVLGSRAATVAASGFMDSAELAGARPSRQFRTEIVPHLVPLAFVYAALSASSALITDGFLGFLGLVENRYSWGIIVDFALSFRNISGTIPWLVLNAASGALSLLALGLFLIAAGVRRWEALKYRESPR
jgi:peptide/nickel transport system permease protein